MNKNKIAIVLGIMVMFLTTSIVIQYKTVKSANSITGSSSSDIELKSEVLKWKQKYDEEYKKLESSEKKLENKRELASKNDTTSSEKQKRLKEVNSVIGSIDVSGKGVVITLQDNPNATSETIGGIENISDYLIHDRDLLRIVNELKNAGAEAISVNDERITNTTSITCDGNVILINGNKISSPFTIKAIGSQEAIIGGVKRPGGLLEEFERYGLVAEVKKQSKVVISKYNGILDYKYLKSE